MTYLKCLPFLIMSFIIIQGCGDDQLTVAECEISYNDDLVPLITTSCVGYCHASANHYATYSNIKEVIDNGILWDKIIVDKTMPLYPQSITQEQRDMFACWIEAGAPNN